MSELNFISILSGVAIVGAKEYASALEWTVVKGEKWSRHLD